MFPFVCLPLQQAKPRSLTAPCSQAVGVERPQVRRGPGRCCAGEEGLAAYLPHAGMDTEAEIPRVYLSSLPCAWPAALTKSRREDSRALRMGLGDHTALSCVWQSPSCPCLLSAMSVKAAA